MVVMADAVAVIVGMVVAGAMVVVAMFIVVVAVIMVVVVASVALVVVVLAHASFPFDGSAICSSISFSTPLIWASAAE